MAILNDLTGCKFSRLEVIERSGAREGSTTWLCRCSCDTEKEIPAKTLILGKSRSCGCLRREYVASQKIPSEKRFWKFADKTPGLGPEGTCWEWMGTKSKKSGHGHFRHEGSVTGAHRVAWILVNGSIPGELCVCHSCDNPPCVNPSHLWLGTRLDNVRDRVNKGRSGKAWTDRTENLSPEVRDRIGKAYSLGLLNIRELAKAFSTADQTIRNIIQERGSHPV